MRKYTLVVNKLCFWLWNVDAIATTITIIVFKEKVDHFTDLPLHTIRWNISTLVGAPSDVYTLDGEGPFNYFNFTLFS